MASENQVGIVSSKDGSSQHERAWALEMAGWPPATARQMAKEQLESEEEAVKGGRE